MREFWALNYCVLNQLFVLRFVVLEEVGAEKVGVLSYATLNG